jgi:Zn-dependent protease
MSDDGRENLETRRSLTVFRKAHRKLYRLLLQANGKVDNVGILFFWVLVLVVASLCVSIHLGWLDDVLGVSLAVLRGAMTYVVISVAAFVALGKYAEAAERRAYEQVKPGILRQLDDEGMSVPTLLAQITDHKPLKKIAELLAKYEGALPADKSDAEGQGEAESHDIVNPRVREELTKIAHPKTGWVRNLPVLIVSLVLFFSFGLFRYPLSGALALVLALFVHEMGHLAAMRLFHYQNVRVFFIPLFGAAAGGQNVTAPGWKRAVVTISGPAAGLAAALLLFVAWVQTGQKALGHAALTFAFLNVFNLLPFFPLDGGRFLQRVLFDRNRYVEASARVLLGSLTVLAGLAMRSWVLTIVGGISVLTTYGVFKVATVALRLRQRDDFPDEVDPSEMPDELVAATLAEIRKTQKSASTPALEARKTWDVWERINSRPPGILASLGLASGYAALLAAVVFVPVLYLLAAKSRGVVEYETPGGTTEKKWQVSVGRLPLLETELDQDGLYHGKKREYALGFEPRVKLEGEWSHGFPHGVWRKLGPDGKPVVETVFDQGQFVVRRELTTAEVSEKRLEELSGQDQEILRLLKERGPFGPDNKVGRLPVN